MWQVPLEVLNIAFTILRMVQNGIDVVKNITLPDFRPVFCLELRECPIRDVFESVRAIFSIGIIGETLYTCIPAYSTFEIDNSMSSQKRLMICSYMSSPRFTEH